MAKADTQQLENDIQQLREDLRALRDDVGNLAQQGSARLGEACNERWRQAEDAVRENPMTAVGIAAGVGLLVGLLGGCGNRH